MTNSCYERCKTCGRLPIPPIDITEEKENGIILLAKLIYYRVKDKYPGHSISIHNIKLVIKAFNRKSAISNTGGDLTIVKITEKNPLIKTNLILVSIAESFEEIPEKAAKYAQSIVNNIDWHIPKENTPPTKRRKKNTPPPQIELINKEPDKGTTQTSDFLVFPDICDDEDNQELVMVSDPE